MLKDGHSPQRPSPQAWLGVPGREEVYLDRFIMYQGWYMLKSFTYLWLIGHLVHGSTPLCGQISFVVKLRMYWRKRPFLAKENPSEVLYKSRETEKESLNWVSRWCKSNARKEDGFETHWGNGQAGLAALRGWERKVLKIPLRFQLEYWDDSGTIKIKMEWLGIRYYMVNNAQQVGSNLRLLSS